MIQSNKNRDRRYLIIAADDFGRSSSVNMAVAEAHDRGIVTASSIMAGGEVFEEAVQIALRRNRLSVGLHVTLCDGRAVLKQSRIPDLVNREGCFEASPARARVRYMRPAVLPQIEAEVEAQFDRLERAGFLLLALNLSGTENLLRSERLLTLHGRGHETAFQS